MTKDTQTPERSPLWGPSADMMRAKAEEIYGGPLPKGAVMMGQHWLGGECLSPGWVDDAILYAARARVRHATNRLADAMDDDGVFRAICDLGPKYLGGSDGLVAGSSRDGLNWTWVATQLMELSAAPAWDSGELYRTTFTPHENGVDYLVWYSANGPDWWRTGLTIMPKSLWPF